MTLFKAIVMGIIQGLTEFLPVSSSGHLAIFKHILNMNTDTGLFFDVCLHLGTLVAIFIAFWKDIRELIIEAFSIIGDLIGNAVRAGRKILGQSKEVSYKKIISTPYRRFVLLILISTIPTGVIGFLLKDMIEAMSTTVLVPGLCLILTAIELVIADRIDHGEKAEATATNADALWVGISQGIATLPGLSRSGTTITACLSRGFERSFAVRYSFIMSIPAVLGAVLLEAKDIPRIALESSETINILVGTIVSAVVGFLCIKTMLVVVRGKKFTYFAVYCFIVGSIAVISYFC